LRELAAESLHRAKIPREARRHRELAANLLGGELSRHNCQQTKELRSSSELAAK